MSNSVTFNNRLLFDNTSLAFQSNRNHMEPTSKQAKVIDTLDLEKKVKSMYRQVALHPKEAYHFEMGRALAEKLGYPTIMLDKVPEQAIEGFAGTGYHLNMANLKEGLLVIERCCTKQQIHLVS